MTKKIVVAEDDKDILFVLKFILNEAGYEVEPLPDGKSIISRSRDWPDLFILDNNMPTISGLALCKYLKLKQETKDIPVVMISAYHNMKKKALQAGVSDFIEKPFKTEQILNVIQKNVAHQM